MIFRVCALCLTTGDPVSEVKVYSLKNSHGMRLNFLNYGGIVTGIFAPDREGKFENVVLGFDDPRKYVLANPPYYGALVGRFANRIGGASFEIDGVKYELAKNDGANSLHGGLRGFDKVFWDVEETELGKRAKLTYLSKDLEEGYPGNLQVEVVYTLTEKNEFAIEYSGSTDKATQVNLTSHSYFNLSGDGSTTVLDHILQIDAERVTASDASYIPTGETVEVSGAIDFRKPRLIAEGINEVHEGYNHNYILNKPNGKSVVAKVAHEKSGRVMEVMTTEPGLQFYSGYFLDTRFNGLALEAQHYPDSPNKPHFPSTVLKPGETYSQKTTYRFKVI